MQTSFTFATVFLIFLSFDNANNFGTWTSLRPTVNCKWQVVHCLFGSCMWSNSKVDEPGK